MLRDIVNIDENLCDGCSLCIPNCHEGALQIIDGKARLVSDLMCDGLGACLGHCPQNAITVEKREAAPYDETEVMTLMIAKGKATVIAHLKHLKEHNETEFLKEGLAVLEKSKAFNITEIMNELNGKPKVITPMGGCPGSAAQQIKPAFATSNTSAPSTTSALQQWPVQMHLINPKAAFFKKSDFLLAADCTAFAVGGFHSEHLQGKMLGIACPKLDSSKENYMKKLISLIDESEINTLTVMIMEVPCCGGLLQLAQKAVAQATRKVPLKVITVSLQGEIKSEQWV